MSQRQSLFKGLGERLASAFFEEEEVHESPQTTETAEGVVGEEVVTTTNTKPAKVVGDTEEMKREVRAQLDEEVPGAYRTFSTLFQSLERAVTDTAQRVKAALATASAQNVSDQAILAAFEERIEEVEEYRDGFAERVAAERETKIGALQTERDRIGEEIEQTEQEIAHLRERLGQLRSSRDASDEALAAEKERIDLLELRMAAVLNDIRNDLEEEQAMVAAHIENVNEGGEV